MELSKINQKAQNAAQEIVTVASLLWEKGWAEAGAGNISVNVTEYFPGLNFDFRASPMIDLKKPYQHIAGNFIFITTKGSRMRSLAKDPGNNICLIKISEAGTAYQVLFEEKDSTSLPSSELPSHLGIHELLAKRGGTDKAVLHTHVQELIALSHIPKYKNEKTLNDMLWSMHPETEYFIPEGIGLVPFELPGSENLATATLKSLQEHPVVLWEKHGCLAIGKDLNEAFDRIEILAKSAEIYFLCRDAGFDPEGLT